MNNQLNNAIAGYQNQKATCEAELQTIGNNKAVAENNLSTLEAQAQQLFGTSDTAQLQSMLENLTIEQTSLEEELNKLNMEA